MRRATTVAALGLTTLALFIGSSAQAAAPVNRALVSNGEIYALVEGSYGELFPGGGETLPANPVLAVAVIHPDGTHSRLLVPQTGGPEVEAHSSLVLDPNGDTVHVLWQRGTGTSSLRLASLDAAGVWAPVVNISRGVPVLPGTVRMAYTRDSVELGGAEPDTGVRMARSVLQVVWLEELDGRTIYAPVVIEDGRYIGDHTLFALEELAPGSGAGEAEGEGGPAPAAGLLPGPVIEPGGDGGAAVAAFVDRVSGSLVTVELRMISGELSQIANSVRDKILDLAAILEPGSEESLTALAAEARAQLLAAGARLDPALLQLLADELEAYILNEGTDWAFQPEAMAERTRRVLVEIGSSFDRTPIHRLHGEARGQMIGVGQRSGGVETSHELRLRVTAERLLPDTGGAPASLFLSGDGEDALVAWEVEGVVYFRESDDYAESGWGPAVGLGITAEDPSLVRELLQARVRER